MTLFEGTGIALVTPFKENGKVNCEKLEEIVEERVTGSTDAIIACGTTGEVPTMTHEEHLNVIEYICRVTKKQIPVAAGTGSNCTEIAAYLSAEAEKRRVDGLLLVSLYYNKATQKGLMVHLTAAADMVKILVILYNIPGRTGATTKPKIIAALCKDVDNIIRVKEASDNLSAIATLISLSDGRVDSYSGNDDQIVSPLSLGGRGVIFVLSSIAPCQTHDIYASYFTEDVKTSASLQLKIIPLTTEFFSEVNLILVEAAMSMMGKGMGPLRMPLTEVEPQNQEKLKKVMADYGILWGRFWEKTVYQ